MMHSKRPSDVERIDLDRCYAESDRQMSLSRRSQAMLAGANESAPWMQWFVLRIAPHAEKDVDKSLREAGIECWLPVEKRVRNAPHAKRKMVYTVPAVPGYMFVKVAACDRAWAGLLSVEGVISVLGGACGPVPVSEAIRLKFKNKLEERSTDAEVVAAAFPVGSAVAIEEGPFASFSGTIEATLADQLAIVLVEIFGRFVPVELSLAQITKTE